MVQPAAMAAIEQQAVEHFAGVDHNRVAHFESSAMAPA